MPNGNHGATTQRAMHGEPQPVPDPLATAENDSNQREPTKKDLASWWRSFKRGNQRREEERELIPLTDLRARADARPSDNQMDVQVGCCAALIQSAKNLFKKKKPTDTKPESTEQERGIFGVPLQTSIRYANVAISLYDAEGKSYIYGYVPIVVAKCGIFLKEKATDVEGIFRLSGSEKRIKELREAFNSPERYGKGLDWSGYTVHDAANILRRYFNQLPEPIIPLNFYDQFRVPLRGHQSQAVGEMEGQSPSVGNFEMDATIKRYQELITQLPPLNRQLLLYILDLLAVFASKSDLNKMTTQNLAAIFQPGVLSHPQHDMSPAEYRLSQDVVIFLIENQDHFLIGMQGTAVDARTVQEVESGPPTPALRTPGSRRSIVGRSGSNASKYSGVRRSVSVSSKHSRGSIGGPTPVTPTMQSPLSATGNGIGVHRSNTVPSKRSPGLPPGRLQQRSNESPPFPGGTPNRTPTQAHPAPPEVTSASSSEQPTPLAPSSAPQTPSDSKTQLGTDPKKPDSIALPANTDRSLAPPGVLGTPTSGVKTTFKDFLAGKSPPTDGRKPNKLQKKRLPGSQNPSANSSSQSLEAPVPGADQLSIGASTASNAPLLGPGRDQLLHPGPQLSTPTKQPPSQTGGEAKTSTSPTASFRSHSTATEPEGLDQLTDAPLPAAERDLTDSEPAQQKKHRWFSRSRDDRSGSQTNIVPPPVLGQNDPAQRSRSSVISGGGPEAGARKSMTVDRSGTTSTYTSSAMGAEAPSVPTGPGVAAAAAAAGDEGEDKKERNPLNWIKGKVRERAEKKEERDRLKEGEKRAKSPPPLTGGRFEKSQSSLAGMTGAEAGLQAPPVIGGGSSIASGRSSGAGTGRSFEIVRGSGRSLDVQRPAQQEAARLLVGQQGGLGVGEEEKRVR